MSIDKKSSTQEFSLFDDFRLRSKHPAIDNLLEIGNKEFHEVSDQQDSRNTGEKSHYVRTPYVKTPYVKTPYVRTPYVRSSLNLDNSDTNQPTSPTTKLSR